MPAARGARAPGGHGMGLLMRIYRSAPLPEPTKRIRSPRQSSLVTSGRPGAPEHGLLGVEALTVRSWHLWFPARLGPLRKRQRTVNGVKIQVRGRVPELPPTKNTKHGNPYGHAAWVREWRREAKIVALQNRIPHLARIRLSAVIYRRALGTADAENDHARLAPLQDGIADAGVILRDTYAYCERGEVREERAGADGPGVMLIVEAVEPVPRDTMIAGQRE